MAVAPRGGVPAIENGNGVSRLREIVWIAVDWGTSNLRVWGIGCDDEIVAEAASSSGMAKLDRAGFEPALLELIGDWLSGDRQMPVIACGMVRARQGLDRSALPAGAVQAGTDPDRWAHPQTIDPRVEGDGYRQDQANQSRARRHAGRGNPDRGHLVGATGVRRRALPSRHAYQMGADQRRRNRSFQNHHDQGTVQPAFPALDLASGSLSDAGWNEIEFSDSVRSTVAEPADLAGRLFSIRAEALISSLDAAMANARLSGPVDQTELAAAKAYWQNPSLIIVGNGPQSELYAAGLRTLGRSPDVIDASQVTLSGLKSAYRQMAREST